MNFMLEKRLRASNMERERVKSRRMTGATMETIKMAVKLEMAFIFTAKIKEKK